MKWYIVIICSEDWFIIFDEAITVKASNYSEAVNKAMDGKSLQVYHVEMVFECGRTKPKEL